METIKGDEEQSLGGVAVSSTRPAPEGDVVHGAMRLLSPVAERYEVKPEHWIHDWDESLSFCFECAEKKVAELLASEPGEDYLIDGGWRTEGDSQAFCETCQCPLDNSYTGYACEQELDHFEEHGFDPASPDDCHAVLEVLMSEGTPSSELWPQIKVLAETVIAKFNEPERDAEIVK